MKNLILLFALIFVFFFAFAPSSCKNKRSESKTEQRDTTGTTAPVQISSDEQLRTSVSNVTKDYPEVRAEVSDGVVTLRGSIEQSKLQDLIMRVQELRPKRVDNQLVVK